MFYSETGDPVIVTLTYHPMPVKEQYRHVLYYRSHCIFEQMCPQIESFFIRLNSLLNIRALPIHAEFRLVGDKELLPIELNPLRYGGLGFSDLS